MVIGVKLVDQQLLGGRLGSDKLQGPPDAFFQMEDQPSMSGPKWGVYIFNIWGHCAGFLIACMLAKVFRYQVTALMFWSQRLIQNGDTLQHLMFRPENHLKHTPSCRCLFGFPLQQSDQWLLIE